MTVRPHDGQPANRLAMFLPTLGGGGAERVTLTLAQGFSDQGLDVDLVVANAQGELRQDIPAGVRLIDLKAHWHIDNFHPLANYLRRKQPDAMLAVLTEANCMAIRARAAAGVQTRLAVAEHSTLSLISSSLKDRPGPSLPELIRDHYPKADAIVAVSRGVADDLANTTGLPRKRIQAIYNPVPADEILVKSCLPLDHPWFSRQQPPVVVAVGRLTAAKDYPCLIRAFARLRQTRAARLLVLGEGPDRAMLEHQIQELGLQDDVRLPGFVSNPYRYMRRADCFVLSSRWEGLPTVLIEALACEAPIVSTRCPNGPAEILENGRWGRLVTPGDDKALAQAMDNTLSAGTQDRRGFLRAAYFSMDRALAAYGSCLGIDALTLHARQAVHDEEMDQPA